MHHITYGEMWEGVGVFSDPHPIGGGGGRRSGGVLLLCPPRIVIGWGYGGPDASHPIWRDVGGGVVSSDPHSVGGGE